jgi:arylsulfatase A-like enzyme
MGAAGVAGTGLPGRDLLASGDTDTGATRRYGSVVLRQRKPDSSAPNLLFVSIDDCNDWLGFLNNHPGTHTPNLDALAGESLVFTQAYCTAPMCLPSRASVLFGRAPHHTEVYDHTEASRVNYARLTRRTSSLIDDFWAAGYDVLGVGKVFHDFQLPRWSDYQPIESYVPGHRRQNPQFADRFDPAWVSPYDNLPIGNGERFNFRMLDFGPSGPASEHPDGLASEWARRRLSEDRRQPFLLAMGIGMPHEPWRVPSKFFDLHPLEGVVVPEFRPDDLADLGSYARDELIDPFRRFELLQETGMWERVVQAYQASISFADDRIGRVLDVLADQSYADETIVIAWSDHGYHLGEKLHIEKFTLWERATRVPLVMHVPGEFDSESTFDPPVSLLDLGPTLADLGGVRIHGRHDGASLLPLVAEPNRADERAPLTTWLAHNHAVRRGPWRYIRYGTGDAELYDHRTDPSEFVNLAGRPENAAIESELASLLPSP